MNEISLQNKELVIQKKNFEIQKAKLKEFSEKIPPSVKLPTTKTEAGLFGWFDHKVTGEEINKLASEIQKHLITTNTYVKDIIANFSDIYKTFDKLDKEYLQGIVLGIKSAEKANDRALKASEEATNAQKDIKRTIEALSQTIKKLSQFKEESIQEIDLLKISLNKSENYIKDSLQKFQRIEKIRSELESYKHFADIDTTWKDVQNHKSEIQNIGKSIQKIFGNIQLLEQFKGKLESIEHLVDIDTTWNDVQNHKSEIQNIGKSIQKIFGNIQLLEQFKEKIESIEHLVDFDATWNDVQNHKSDIETLNKSIQEIKDSVGLLQQHKDKMDKLVHLIDIDNVWEDMQLHKKELFKINENLTLLFNKNTDLESSFLKTTNTINQKIELNNQVFNKKLKTSYLIAGGAVFISLVQFILYLTGTFNG